MLEYCHIALMKQSERFQNETNVRLKALQYRNHQYKGINVKFCMQIDIRKTKHDTERQSS